MNIYLSSLAMVLALGSFQAPLAAQEGTPAPREWYDAAPPQGEEHKGKNLPVPPQVLANKRALERRARGEKDPEYTLEDAKALAKAAQEGWEPAKAIPSAPAAAKDVSPEVPPEAAAQNIPVEYRPMPEVRTKTPYPGKPFRYVKVPTSTVRVDRKKPYMRVYYWPPLPAGSSVEDFKTDKPVDTKPMHYGMVMDPIYFPFNDSEMVAPSSYLDQIAGWLKEDGNHGITLTGHADPRGTAARNKRLSLERADAVKAALVRLGAAEGQIKTVGLGATKPGKKGKTQEAKHWGSRRVEMALHPLNDTKVADREPKVDETSAETQETMPAEQ